MDQISLSSLPVAILLPALLLATTSFIRISVVFAALRMGLGAERLLPASVMTTLSLLVTILIMYPTLRAGYAGWNSLLAGDAALGGGSDLERLRSVVAPLWDFMAAHASAAERDFFAELQGYGSEHPLVVLPAFLFSEVEAALKSSIVILAPFWLFDILAAQLIAMLNWSISAAFLTLPAKLLFFQAIDGWHLIVGSLYQSYR
jgi:flagellar biosynthesis protein FliP